jgi:hypothetical protein
LLKKLVGCKEPGVVKKLVSAWLEGDMVKKVSFSIAGKGRG